MTPLEKLIFIFQSELVRQHGDEFRVCWLALIVADGIAE